MELRVIEGIPPFAALLDLINAEWPKQFGDKTDEEKIADIADDYNQERDRMKILYDGNTAAAFYRYSLWPRNARLTDAAHIYDISILPDYRGKGVGIFLMQDMITDCGERGIRRLLSHTFKDNEVSIALHRKAGFRMHLENDVSIVWEIFIDKNAKN